LAVELVHRDLRPGVGLLGKTQGKNSKMQCLVGWCGVFGRRRGARKQLAQGERGQKEG